MPQANSTMSMPRVTSPCASVKTLPCSAVISARQIVAVLVQQFEKVVHHTRAAIGGVSAQAHRQLRRQAVGVHVLCAHGGVS
jgi:hypothetical protein